MEDSGLEILCSVESIPVVSMAWNQYDGLCGGLRGGSPVHVRLSDRLARRWRSLGGIYL